MLARGGPTPRVYLLPHSWPHGFASPTICTPPACRFRSSEVSSACLQVPQRFCRLTATKTAHRQLRTSGSRPRAGTGGSGHQLSAGGVWPYRILR